MTAWPWPLNGVQAWFESFWNSINSWIWDSVRWLYSNLGGWFTWLRDRVSESVSWVQNRVWGFISWLRDRVNEAASWISNRIWGFIQWLKDRVGDFAQFILQNVRTFVDNLRNSFFASLGWVRDSIFSALDGAKNTIITAFDGAFRGFLDAIIAPLKGFFNFIQGWLKILWEKLFEILTGFATWLRNQLNNFLAFIAGLLNAARAIFTPPLTTLAKTIIDSMTHAVKPSTPPQEIALALENFMTSLYEESEALVEQMYSSPIALATAPTLALRAATLLTVSQTTGEAVATAVDAAHPLRRIGIPDIVRSLIRTLGLSAIASAPLMIMFETSLFRPLRYYYNQVFAPWIPTAPDLVNQAVRRILTPEDYYYNMRLQGYDAVWADRMLRAAYRLPSFLDAREMYWRGVIDINKVTECLRSLGIREDYVFSYHELIWRIPPISDLIRFVVREVITPNQFYSLARQQGFMEEFARMYWDAHWVLPPPARTWDAFLRGVITEDAYRRFLIWYDYSPEPRPGIGVSDVDIMLRTQYDLPGRIDARWMYEWGHIDKDTLREIIKMRGIDPDWIDKVTDAEATNIMREEIMGLIREAITDRRDGWINDEEFIARLRDLGIPEERIDYYLARAKSAYAREYREEQARIFSEQFRRGILTEDEYRERLAELGLSPERVESRVVLDRLRISAKPRPVRLTPAEQYISRVLQVAGITADDILSADLGELRALARELGVTWRMLVSLAIKLKRLG